jgi:hypothetical protein
MFGVQISAVKVNRPTMLATHPVNIKYVNVSTVVYLTLMGVLLYARAVAYFQSNIIAQDNER